MPGKLTPLAPRCSAGVIAHYIFNTVTAEMNSVSVGLMGDHPSVPVRVAVSLSDFSHTVDIQYERHCAMAPTAGKIAMLTNARSPSLAYSLASMRLGRSPCRRHPFRARSTGQPSCCRSLWAAGTRQWEVATSKAGRGR